VFGLWGRNKKKKEFLILKKIEGEGEPRVWGWVVGGGGGGRKTQGLRCIHHFRLIFFFPSRKSHYIELAREIRLAEYAVEKIGFMSFDRNYLFASLKR